MQKSRRLARARPQPPRAVARRADALEALREALGHHRDGRLDAAEKGYRRALSLDGDQPVALRAYGKLLLSAGRPEEAVPHFARAVRLLPDDADALVEHGAALKEAGRAAEALPLFRRALARAPGHVGGLTGLGATLLALGEVEEAVGVLARAVAAGPASGAANAQYVNALLAASRPADAEEASRRAVASVPGHAEVRLMRGIVLARLGRRTEALAAYRAAAALAPQDARFRAYVASALAALGREEEAVAELESTLALDGTNALANARLGSILVGRNRHAEALPALKRAVAADPDCLLALFELCEAKRAVCEWEGLPELEERLQSLTASGNEPLPPFHAFSLGVGPAGQRAYAARWARNLAYDDRDVLPAPPPCRAEGRIRIGYLSGDFRAHATAYLAAELFERHDRLRFETFAYAYGDDDGSQMRRRLVAAFDHFVDVDALPDRAAAERIRADGIDILVDLKGYTLQARTEIVALRPAPVQVNFLGYPGTMGASFVDYIVADRVIVPPEHEPHFAERVVRLPHAYQPNDTRREIAADRPSRADCGLPRDGFVFASFNDSYKITPRVFGLWMRLLERVPGSVLWLLESNALARENLLAAAARAGIPPERLVFAPKWRLDRHLARIANADLFLDTLPVTAHTTASDCLWAGLPVLTCLGDSMVSRVAASLLEAVGLPELVTRSLEEYEALALDLARDRDRLAALRARLAGSGRTSPLFDIARYTRNLERAYEEMRAISARGERPCAIEVADVGPATGDAASCGAAGGAPPATAAAAPPPLQGGPPAEPPENGRAPGSGRNAPMPGEPAGDRAAHDGTVAPFGQAAAADSAGAPGPGGSGGADLTALVDDILASTALDVTAIAPAPRAAPSPAAFPRVMNLGPGASFREDCLNVDADPARSPDAVADLSRLDLSAGPITLPSLRFGEVTLAPGAFDRIVAGETFARVPDPTALMANCLVLLREGGTLEITIPHGLSAGAWAHPATVRAFGERSFLPYTEGFWQLGWSEARFRQEALVLHPSPLGEAMRAAGADDATLSRTPRAVEAFTATLRKSGLDSEDRAALRRWRDGREAAAHRRAEIRAARPPLPFSGGWRAHADAHAVWVVSPPGYVHSRGLDDVAAALSEAFAELGGSAPFVRRPEDLAGRTPIVLGAHLLPEGADLPPDAILLNLEQAGPGNPNFTPAYRALLRRHPVLDYSARNARALALEGVESLRVLPIGYAPSLTRVAHRAQKDVDVLFYGSLNPRRKRILVALENAGVKVLHRFGVYGAERDEAIGRARIVLNLHFYETAIFEVVRVSYLLANAAPVVTEGDADDEDIAPFRDGLAIAPYDGLVAACRALLADAPRRQSLARAGFALMTRRRQADLLGALMTP